MLCQYKLYLKTDYRLYIFPREIVINISPFKTELRYGEFIDRDLISSLLKTHSQSGSKTVISAGWPFENKFDVKPIIFFESPRRIQNTLGCLEELCPDRLLLTTREISKIYEERFIGTPTETLDHYDHPRGEFTIIVNSGEPLKEESNEHWVELNKQLKQSGITGRAAAVELSKIAGISKSRAYRFILENGDISKRPR